MRERLQEEGIFKETEKDYINYALHSTLWNIDTLAEPTRSKLIDKMNSEWFEALGIKGKPEEYFYNKKEYKQYKKIRR